MVLAIMIMIPARYAVLEVKNQKYIHWRKISIVELKLSSECNAQVSEYQKNVIRLGAEEHEGTTTGMRTIF
jgi:hypothetical protein